MHLENKDFFLQAAGGSRIIVFQFTTTVGTYTAAVGACSSVSSV